MLLLAVKLALDTIETCHQLLNLLVGLLLSCVFVTFCAIKDVELVAELLLDILNRVRARLVFLLAIDSDKVREVRALLSLTDLNNNPHDDVFEGIFTLAFLLRHADQVSRHVEHIVTRELALLLQNLVLIDE